MFKNKKKELLLIPELLSSNPVFSPMFIIILDPSPVKWFIPIRAQVMPGAANNINAAISQDLVQRLLKLGLVP